MTQEQFNKAEVILNKIAAYEKIMAEPKASEDCFSRALSTFDYADLVLLKVQVAYIVNNKIEKLKTEFDSL